MVDLFSVVGVYSKPFTFLVTGSNPHFSNLFLLREPIVYKPQVCSFMSISMCFSTPSPDINCAEVYFTDSCPARDGND